MHPRIFIQECSTGRRLPPLTDPELDDVKGWVIFKGACLSNDRQYLAISLGLSDRRDSRYDYIAVWAIAKKLNFEVGHRTSTWASKLFSSTVKIETNKFNGSIEPVVFADDGSLCCPVGQINLSTDEVHPLPAELRTGRQIRSCKYSEDGKMLSWTDYADSNYDSDKGIIHLYSFENKQSRSFPFSTLDGEI